MKIPHPISNSKTFHRFTSLGNETVKQEQHSCKNSQNIDETKSLKSLAIKVLQRNRKQNNDETKPSKPETKISNDVLNNHQQIKEEAEYLFFERLGISDDEELALEQAFEHIINQLTIH
jgi:hypothetical protein